MSSLEIAFAEGQLAALARFKGGGLTPTNPVVRRSAVNSGAPGQLPQMLKQPPTPQLDPPTLARQFADVEQNETRVEPRRKLSADNICTSCRKEKHYGPCKRPIPIPIKRADFNMGMTGDDPSVGDNPSTSPHYTSATSSVSALTRAQEGRPADEQASTAFRDLLRSRDLMMSDEGGLLTSGLAKVSSALRSRMSLEAMPLREAYEPSLTLGTRYRMRMGDAHVGELQVGPQNEVLWSKIEPRFRGMGLGKKLYGEVTRTQGSLLTDPDMRSTAADRVWQSMANRGYEVKRPPIPDRIGMGMETRAARLPKATPRPISVPLPKKIAASERRGPFVNPYEERAPGPVPVTGRGDDGTSSIWRSFDSTSGDVTSVGGGAGTPTGGPAA